MSTTEFLWVEKHRPHRIADCILPENLQKTFGDIVKSGEIHNMLLAGTAGTGKTTVARALCDELGLDYIVINGSEDSGIDVLRGRIRQFASSISLSESGPKVVILDEADYLNPQSTQPALRGFIEEFSSNCRFILTCNFKNRIIEPLHSRCAVIEFNTTKKVLFGELAGRFMKRLKHILTVENVKFEEKVLLELIVKFAPDWRRIINECQRHAAGGIIDSGILVNATDASLQGLVKALKEKDFKTMRQWVANNMDLEPASIFRKIFDNLNEYAAPGSIPQIVVVLAEYQFKNSFVADRELNMVACMTELMANAEWK